MRHVAPAVLLLLAAAPASAQQADPRAAQALQDGVAMRLGRLELENAQMDVLLRSAQQDARAARDELARLRTSRPAK